MTTFAVFLTRVVHLAAIVAWLLGALAPAHAQDGLRATFLHQSPGIAQRLFRADPIGEKG